MNFTEFSQAIQENISQVIIGKADVTELMLVALLVEGHVLLEDVPGIGKTTLAKALARSLDCSFGRIQFTPDLLPSDVTGLNIYNQKRQDFEFRPGPVLNQVLLADEINRATPRTQSSLLEAMQEQQITVDGATYHLPRPLHSDSAPKSARVGRPFSAARGASGSFSDATSVGLSQPGRGRRDFVTLSAQ